MVTQPPCRRLSTIPHNRVAILNSSEENLISTYRPLTPERKGEALVLVYSVMTEQTIADEDPDNSGGHVFVLPGACFIGELDDKTVAKLGLLAVLQISQDSTSAKLSTLTPKGIIPIMSVDDMEQIFYLRESALVALSSMPQATRLVNNAVYRAMCAECSL